MRSYYDGLEEMRRKYLLLGIAVALALAAAAALRYRRPSVPRNLVLVSIDTLRADRLGCYGYSKIRTPHMDRFAAEGVLFENAVTVTPLTLPAHCSILTGRTPLRHRVFDNFGYRLEESENTLAELLGAKGFATGGFVGSFVLDSRWGMAQGFDTYYDRFDAPPEKAATVEANQRPGDKVLAPALEWIRQQEKRPFFAFIHFFDPHAPYTPPEPYRGLYGSSGEQGLYDGEVAFVDSLMGELVSALKAQGIYEETLLLVVGDHGESLGEHGEASHGYFIYDATVRVPLLIRGPQVPAGARVKAQVRTIDIVPTVLDLLGVRGPAQVEGMSVVSLIRDPASDPSLHAYIESRYAQIHFGWAPLRAVRTNQYKFIEAPVRELYDLRADPGEAKNLYSEKPGAADQLASIVKRLQTGEVPPAPSSASADSATAERLRALGYLAARTRSSSSRSPDPSRLADPKEKLLLFERFAEGRDALTAGKLDHAAALLEEVLQEDPDLMMAYVILGSIRLRQNRFSKAKGIFRGALARDGQSLDAVYGLAVAYKEQGQLEEAAVGFERCLEIDPLHTGTDYALGFQSMRASYQLAEVRMAQGRHAEAEELLRRTLEARPSDNSVRLLLVDALLAQGKFEPALAELGEARRLAPTDPRVHQGIGNAMARAGNTTEALVAFKKAAELGPDFAPAHHNVGITLMRLGRLDEAEKALVRATEVDPEYAQAFNSLGALYLRKGEAEKAAALFRRALTLKPDYAQARANLAAALRAGR